MYIIGKILYFVKISLSMALFMINSFWKHLAKSFKDDLSKAYIKSAYASIALSIEAKRHLVEQSTCWSDRKMQTDVSV